ncbi:MAG: PD40 domain-containing protein [Planctomycetes bacterium]|nr:PD40 domain-containing protein [Planctomycetota bacterium]
MPSSRSLPFVVPTPGVMLGTFALLVVVCLRSAPASNTVLPTTRLASVTAGGHQGSDASHYPAVSADGRFVVFASDAANLVSGDTNGAGDIFVKDMNEGGVVCVSRNAAGGPAQGESYAASISGAGARVAFASEAADLVVGDTNGQPDVFVRDLIAGTTTRASAGAAGEGDGASAAPCLSADGRFVAFASRATNLVSNDTNGVADVFVRDLQTGLVECVSAAPAGVPGNDASASPALSADGRYVVFASSATNLIAGRRSSAESGYWCIYRRDRQLGTTIRVSANTAGLRGNSLSSQPAVSADGRYVAFASLATDLVGSDLDGQQDIFVRDVVAGTTVRASLGPAGIEPNGPSSRPAISADGRYVVFESEAANLNDGYVPPGSAWCYGAIW